MSRTIGYLSFMFVSIGVVAWARMGSSPQDAMSLPYVRLQAGTPGQQQSGHVNVSGTLLAGKIGVGTINPYEALTVDGAIHASAAWDFAVRGDCQTPGGIGVKGFASASTGNNFGGYFDAYSPNGTGVYGSNYHYGGYTIGVWGEVMSPNGEGVRGSANALTGTTFGGYFENMSMEGHGVYGYVSSVTGATYGVQGRSASSAGTGVFGWAHAATGSTYGVQGRSDSSSGQGVYGAALAASGTTSGVFGRSLSGSGTGVAGEASATSGFTTGVSGSASSSSGTGVAGSASSASGFTWGVVGTSASTSGQGVHGKATATTGTTYGVYGQSDSLSGYGVFGYASASTGTTYGVMGSAPSASGWALYASGRIGGSIKAWRLDHPLDPENYYLVHYSSESPEPLNVYSGTAVTDAQGYATVRLPDYFSEINKDPRIQLTVVDEEDSATFTLAKVVGKVRGNSFRLRTSAGRTEVFWRVEAVRNDRWVQRYGAPAEVEKEGTERGRYLDPELYGQPANKGVFWRPGHQRESQAPLSGQRGSIPPRPGR